MNTSGLERSMSRFTYIIWICVFVAGIIATLYALYFATRQIDYIWRWYKIPRYFFSQDTVEIRAENHGTVQAIAHKDGSIVITVGGPDGPSTQTAPSKATLRVAENDNVFPGDVLAFYTEWQTGILLQGLWITLKVSIYSILFGIIIGLIGGLARLSGNPAVRWSALTYVELIRGSPLLVQIFIWYFVLATVFNELLHRYGYGEIPAMWYGIASLSFFAGAYITEMVRAGIQSVHRGQIEASRSLGMTYAQSMYHVILPQAMRRVLPPLAGEFINLIKDSSLLGLIAIRELTKATREGITTSLQPYEFWFTCALLYLALTFTLSMMVKYLERRTAPL
jgi:polar amino acid transport system permease protein